MFFSTTINNLFAITVEYVFSVDVFQEDVDFYKEVHMQVE